MTLFPRRNASALFQDIPFTFTFPSLPPPSPSSCLPVQDVCPAETQASSRGPQVECRHPPEHILRESADVEAGIGADSLVDRSYRSQKGKERWVLARGADDKGERDG